MIFWTIIFLTTTYIEGIGNTVTSSTSNSRELSTLESCRKEADEIQKSQPLNVTIVCAKLIQPK